MIWRKDTPKNTGEYVVFVPAFTSPFPETKEPFTCSVHKAWFDGNCFILEERQDQNHGQEYLRPGKCLWIPAPKIYANGKYSDYDIDFDWVEKGYIENV